MLQLLRKMLAREEMMNLLRTKEVETTSAGTAVRKDISHPTVQSLKSAGGARRRATRSQTAPCLSSASGAVRRATW